MDDRKNTRLTVEQALFQLGKELTCSICLSIMHTPCARLPCCHYFCKECIQQSLRVKPACPVCKSATHRRDVFEDDKIDRIIGLYAHIENAMGQQLLCTQLPPEHAADWMAPPPDRQELQPKPAKKRRSDKESRQLDVVSSGDADAGHAAVSSDVQQAPSASLAAAATEHEDLQAQHTGEHSLEDHQEKDQTHVGLQRKHSGAESVPSWIKAHMTPGPVTQQDTATTKLRTPEVTTDPSKEPVMPAAMPAHQADAAAQLVPGSDADTGAVDERTGRAASTRRRSGRTAAKAAAAAEHHLASPSASRHQAPPGIAADGAGALAGSGQQTVCPPDETETVTDQTAPQAAQAAPEGAHDAAAAGHDHHAMLPPPNRPAASAAATTLPGGAGTAAAMADTSADGQQGCDGASQGQEGPRYRSWLQGLRLEDLPPEDMLPLSSTDTGTCRNRDSAAASDCHSSLQRDSNSRQHKEQQPDSSGLQQQQQDVEVQSGATGLKDSHKGRTRRGAVAAAAAVAAVQGGADGDGDDRAALGKKRKPAAASREPNTRQVRSTGASKARGAAAVGSNRKQMSMYSFMASTQQDCSQTTAAEGAGAGDARVDAAEGVCSDSQQLLSQHGTNGGSELRGQSGEGRECRAAGNTGQQVVEASCCAAQKQHAGEPGEQSRGGVAAGAAQQPSAPAGDLDVPAPSAAVAGDAAAADREVACRMLEHAPGDKETTGCQIMNVPEGGVAPGEVPDEVHQPAAGASKVDIAADETGAGAVKAKDDGACASAAAAGGNAADEGAANAFKGAGGQSDRSSRRRIPTRLQPWSCSACTYQNQGTVSKCSVCKTPRGKAEPDWKLALQQEDLLQHLQEVKAATDAAADGAARKPPSATASGVMAEMGPCDAPQGKLCVVPAALTPGVERLAQHTRVAQQKERKAGRSPADPVQQAAAGDSGPSTSKLLNSRRMAATDATAAASTLMSTPPGVDCTAGGGVVTAQPALHDSSAEKHSAPRRAQLSALKRPSPASADRHPVAQPGSKSGDSKTAGIPHSSGTKRPRLNSKQTQLRFSPVEALQCAGEAAVEGTQRLTPTSVGRGVALARHHASAAAVCGVVGEPAKSPAATVAGTGAKAVVLVGSGLLDSDKVLLKKAAASAGGRVSEGWTLAATHVVCAVNENKQARRTLKYMQGILAGCWVVSREWLVDSLAASGKLLPEAPYEVLGDSSSGEVVGGPSRGRLHKAEGRAPLLAGWEVFVLGAGDAKEGCISLVKNAGGAVVARLPPAPSGPVSQQQQDGEGAVAEDGKKLLVIMPEGGNGSGAGNSSKGPLGHAAALGVPVLAQRWLMDSVSHMQLLPMEGYKPT